MTAMDAPLPSSADIDRSVLESLDSSRLRLIVLPTEQCNFRCSYCYEDFALGHMSPALVRALKLFIERRIEDLRLLQIDWFGGEPLLAHPVIEDVSSFAQGLCETGGVRFRSSATTNGSLLTPERLQRLVDSGVNDFQISLDGFGAQHDRTRVAMNGAGTFERIWGNLLAARDSDLGFTVSLRVHMHPDNASALPELVGAIRAEFGGDRRFSVFFKGVGRYGGPGDATLRVFSSQEARAVKRQLEALLGDSFANRSLTPSPSYVCYAAQANSLVIRSNGRLAKCTVAFADERNDVGCLKPDGTLEIDAEHLQVWLFGIETRKQADLACPYSRLKEDGSRLIPLRPSS